MDDRQKYLDPLTLAKVRSLELQARLVTEWARLTKRGPIRAPLPGTGGEVRDSAGGRRG